MSYLNGRKCCTILQQSWNMLTIWAGVLMFLCFMQNQFINPSIHLPTHITKLSTSQNPLIPTSIPPSIHPSGHSSIHQSTDHSTNWSVGVSTFLETFIYFNGDLIKLLKPIVHDPQFQSSVPLRQCLGPTSSFHVSYWHNDILFCTGWWWILGNAGVQVWVGHRQPSLQHH